MEQADKAKNLKKIIRAYTGTEPYIFCSYAHSDADKVGEILAALQKDYYRIWYDEGLHSGASWNKEISGRISHCHVFLLFLSENSMRSENVLNELNFALNRHIKLVIISIDEVTLTEEMEFMIGRFQIINRSTYDTLSDFVARIKQDLLPITVAPREQTESALTISFDDLYQIEKVASEGYMGNGCFAIQKRTGSRVFVKHFCFDPNSPNHMQYVTRLRTEKEALLALSHCPYTPSLLDYFEDENNIYLVEEFVDGKLLQSIYNEFSEERSVKVMLHLARAMQYLHNHNPQIIHRDIKPANIFVNQYDDVFLVDFDICKIGQQPVIPMGTMGFAPPEQFSGFNSVTSDIYSLGVTFHLMLTHERVAAEAVKYPVRYYDQTIHPGLELIIEKMTEKNSAFRYQSIENVIEDLECYKDITATQLWKMQMISDKNIAALKDLPSDSTPVTQNSFFQNMFTTGTLTPDNTPTLPPVPTVPTANIYSNVAVPSDYNCTVFLPMDGY